jgi:hypothetical protein
MDMAMSMAMETTIAQARMGKVTTPITVKGVVTVVNGDDPKDTKEWYIQDPAGGPYSGISVYCNKDTRSMTACPEALNPPALHDLVLVTGTISPYRGKAEIQPTAQMTLMANATPPPSMMVSGQDVAPASKNAAVLGALVQLTGGPFTVEDVRPSALYNTTCAGHDGGSSYASCSGCNPPTYEGVKVKDGSGNEVLVTNLFFLTEHLHSSPECLSGAPANQQLTVGKTFTALSGIVDVDVYAPAGNNITISPTTDSDYSIQ